MSLDITKLPKELLALIFEHLTKANDRRRVAQACKLFYEIVRHQSTLKQDNMLRMKGSDLDASPIRVLENSAFFPFSELCIKHFDNNIITESAFWTLHGQEINEIIFDDETVHMEPVLSTLNKYFPNLKKLEIKSQFLQSSDAENSENILLPIEYLSIDIWEISVDQIVALLRCSPLLKYLKIKHIHADHLPQILPWLETIERSRLFLYEEPLGKLINLPSKVVIGELTIRPDETLETIREFFKQPRTIETLFLYSKNDNELSYEDVEENADNPNEICFTREQALALSAAKTIKNVHIYDGVLEFEGSLDVLAQLPGVESISLQIHAGLPNPLYPFYWSTPETALKIREIDYMDVTNLDQLTGLSSVTSIKILRHSDPRGLSSEEIQTLIRNCPNLRKLSVPRINATDADLSGHGNLPFSSLEKLESLNIFMAPNISSEAFKSALKFPNLKSFTLYTFSSKEQPFNQNVAKQFTQNCPNLEQLEIENCLITEEGFDILVRHLPYLRWIHIEPIDKLCSLNKVKVEEIQKEFPYIDVAYSPPY